MKHQKSRLVYLLHVSGMGWGGFFYKILWVGGSGVVLFVTLRWGGWGGVEKMSRYAAVEWVGLVLGLGAWSTFPQLGGRGIVGV